MECICVKTNKNLASHDEFRIRMKNKKHKNKTTTTHSKNQESVNLNHSFIHSLGPNEQKHTHTYKYWIQKILPKKEKTYVLYFDSMPFLKTLLQTNTVHTHTTFASSITI